MLEVFSGETPEISWNQKPQEFPETSDCTLLFKTTEDGLFLDYQLFLTAIIKTTVLESFMLENNSC